MLFFFKCYIKVFFLYKDSCFFKRNFGVRCYISEDLVGKREIFVNVEDRRDGR